MNSNSINGTHTPEKQMLELFRGACLGVRAMHAYRPSSSSSAPNDSSSLNPAGPSMPRSRSPVPDHDDHESSGLLNHPSSSNRHDDDDHDHDDEEGEGFSYAQGASIPQVVDKMESSRNDVVFDGDEELRRVGGGAGNGNAKSGGEVVPYAHRDIKPAYVWV